MSILTYSQFPPVLQHIISQYQINEPYLRVRDQIRHCGLRFNYDIGIAQKILIHSKVDRLHVARDAQRRQIGFERPEWVNWVAEAARPLICDPNMIDYDYTIGGDCYHNCVIEPLSPAVHPKLHPN